MANIDLLQAESLTDISLIQKIQEKNINNMESSCLDHLNDDLIALALTQRANTFITKRKENSEEYVTLKLDGKEYSTNTKRIKSIFGKTCQVLINNKQEENLINGFPRKTRQNILAASQIAETNAENYKKTSPVQSNVKMPLQKAQEINVSKEKAKLEKKAILPNNNYLKDTAENNKNNIKAQKDDGSQTAKPQNIQILKTIKQNTEKTEQTVHQKEKIESDNVEKPYIPSENDIDKQAFINLSPMASYTKKPYKADEYNTNSFAKMNKINRETRIEKKNNPNILNSLLGNNANTQNITVTEPHKEIEKPIRPLSKSIVSNNENLNLKIGEILMDAYKVRYNENENPEVTIIVAPLTCEKNASSAPIVAFANASNSAIEYEASNPEDEPSIILSIGKRRFVIKGVWKNGNFTSIVYPQNIAETNVFIHRQEFRTKKENTIGHYVKRLSSGEELHIVPISSKNLPNGNVQFLACLRSPKSYGAMNTAAFSTGNNFNVSNGKINVTGYGSQNNGIFQFVDNEKEA